MGFLFAFLAALFQTLQDIAAKRSVKNFDPISVTFALNFYSIPLMLIPLWLSWAPIEHLSYWILLVMTCATLDSIGLFLYIKAISIDDLSLLAPLASISPLFATLIALGAFGERPSTLGLLGVLLIVLGAYSLNIKDIKHGFFAPIKALIKREAPRYVVLACLLFACAWNLHKAGLMHSNGIQWSAAAFTARVILLYPFSRKSLQLNHLMKIDLIKSIGLVGLFSAATFLSGVLALNYLLVAYVSSIKRISILMSVLAGYFIFKEGSLRERMVSAALMISGVILMLLF